MQEQQVSAYFGSEASCDRFRAHERPARIEELNRKAQQLDQQPEEQDDV